MSHSKPRILLAEMSRNLHEGPAQCALRLLREHDRERCEIVPVFSLDHPEFETLQSMFDCRMYNITMPRPTLKLNPITAAGFALRANKAVNEIADIIGRERIDIVHGNSIINMHVAIAAHREELPFVLSVHEIMDEKRINNAYIRWVCEKAHIVHAVSLAVKQRLRDAGVPEQKIEVVPNGIRIERTEQAQRDALRAEFGIPPLAPVVGIVGTITELKGHHVLLEAARELIEFFPGLRVIVVGAPQPDSEAYMDGLREVADEHLKGRVIFTGRRNDVPAFMSLFDVHAQPSVRGDSMPLTVLEAMGAGTPTVASNIGGIPEMIVPHKTGVLVAPGEPEALAGAIAHLLADSEFRGTLGRAARQRAADEFSETRQVRRILDLYRMSVSLYNY